MLTVVEILMLTVVNVGRVLRDLQNFKQLEALYNHLILMLSFPIKENRDPMMGSISKIHLNVSCVGVPIRLKIVGGHL